AVAAVMVWKSTAILVQMTSSPTAGRTPRRGQVCGDRTSDAVGSESRGSRGGAIAMRLGGSPDRECGCRSTVCHPMGGEMRMCHTVSQGPATDTRTPRFSHKL